MKSSKHLLAAAVAASIMVPMSASATNGYFGLAYGAKHAVCWCHNCNASGLHGCCREPGRYGSCW